MARALSASVDLRIVHFIGLRGSSSLSRVGTWSKAEFADNLQYLWATSPTRGGRRRQHFVWTRGLPIKSRTADLTTSCRAGQLQTSVEHRAEDASRDLLDSALNGGLVFQWTVIPSPGKKRLDTYVAEQIPRASRAKVQACIKGGHVLVNSQPQTKPASTVRPGDVVLCRLPPPPPLQACPEAIPLQVVHEDDHVIVVNKPPHMVVHPSPGHYTGTLVNALLHHCKLPAMQVAAGSSPLEDDLLGNSLDEMRVDDNVEDTDLLNDDEEASLGPLALVPGLRGPQPIIRPGIVHRLDKGTSGLLVVAKDDHSHARLCEQFKARSVQRVYVSVVCGVPQPLEGRIEAPIGRDPRDRKRMAVVMPDGRSRRSRFAASRYKVVEVVAGGGASVVEWRLETGRTHQIRVHARHMGHPILGDEAYGGAGKGALVELLRHAHNGLRASAQQLVARLPRPCLHAWTLGFVHPETTEKLFFSARPPSDFDLVVSSLRELARPRPL